MKRVVTFVFSLLVITHTALACAVTECADANKCYGKDGISCNQSAKCAETNGQAHWVPLDGGGTLCGAPFKMTILSALATGKIPPFKNVDVTYKVQVCNEREVCTFTMKGNSGLLGDPVPGAHIILDIKYVCRSGTRSKGVVKIRYENDEEPVDFNCIE